MNFKHYRWDSRNQLRAVDTPSGETWFYRYDPFGRRVSKRCAERGEEVRYLWDGEQIAEVRHYRQGQQTSRRHRVYNCWELVVQQRHTAAGGWETDFVSSAQNGEPQALYDSEGELRWQAPKATLWGHRAVAKTESADPGLAFAGQLRDSESGLCYNRFRYYDPAGGGYISPDPIGIAGGHNNYAYAPNPLTWIDPLGLMKCGLTGNEVGDATNLPVIKRGSPEWKKAIETIQSGGKSNFRVKDKTTAEQLLKDARGKMDNQPTYSESPYKKGYEHHPNESHTINAPENNIPHIKWKDWSLGKKSGGAGHIFYE